MFLALLAYFGVNLAAYFTDPYTTTVAYAYTGENAVTVSGYVVREEEVLAGGGELVYSSRKEGERVGRGGTVAVIYPTAQAACLSGDGDKAGRQCVHHCDESSEWRNPGNGQCTGI